MPSPVKTKRARRTQDELHSLKVQALKFIDEEGRMTIRHLFYRLCMAGAIEKTENAYKNLIGHLSKWRRDGSIRYSAFTDNTRWYYGSQGHTDLEDALRTTAEAYRKNLWNSQPHYVEVWCEKEAIASILVDAARPFGVQVFVCRGFPSLTSLSSCAELLRAEKDKGKDAHILYFGDHDPSGKAIDTTITSSLANDFGVDVDFARCAVTLDQVRTLSLPTRPVKKGDLRAGEWEGGCVDIDAMSSAQLSEVVESEITKFIDQREWWHAQRAEELEKETLNSMISNLAA